MCVYNKMFTTCYIIKYDFQHRWLNLPRILSSLSSIDLEVVCMNLEGLFSGGMLLEMSRDVLAPCWEVEDSGEGCLCGRTLGIMSSSLSDISWPPMSVAATNANKYHIRKRPAIILCIYINIFIYMYVGQIQNPSSHDGTEFRALSLNISINFE